MHIVDIVAIAFIVLSDKWNFRIGGSGATVRGCPKFREAVMMAGTLGSCGQSVVGDEKAAIVLELRMKGDTAETFGSPIVDPIRGRDTGPNVQEYFGLRISQIIDDHDSAYALDDEK